jgi:hypothetical protein
VMTAADQMVRALIVSLLNPSRRLGIPDEPGGPRRRSRDVLPDHARGAARDG